MTCYDLKMAQFIRCLLGEETLPEWETVYSEYIGLRENRSASYILSLVNEIDYLRSKQFVIFTLIKVMADTYDIRLVIELKKKGCKGKFDWQDKESYSNDLRATYSYGKRLNTHVARKEKELDDYNKRHGGEGFTKMFFENLAATLGKYHGQYIDYDILTVSRFCAMWNQYDRFCEVENATANNLLNKQPG